MAHIQNIRPVTHARKASQDFEKVFCNDILEVNTVYLARESKDFIILSDETGTRRAAWRMVGSRVNPFLALMIQKKMMSDILIKVESA